VRRPKNTQQHPQPASPKEAQGEYSTLIKQLKEVKTPDLRAKTLAKVLLVADELQPQFATLLDALHEGERTLVLGSLLAATRLEPSAERRIVRLKRLLEVSPETVQGVYWLEAETFATTGGDDARLSLLGLVKQLPVTLQPATLRTLKKAVHGVEEVFKRATAFVALSELTWLSNDERREAEQCAARIPDTLLRVMTLKRLEKINLERFPSDRPEE
jgi:hypothetical protein